MNYVMNTTHMIVRHFDDYISSGSANSDESAPSVITRTFDKLYTKQTLGDPLKRVHWRT